MKHLTQSTKLVIILLTGTAMMTFSSCKKDDPEKGCTNSQATNYNANAEEDDGSCSYARTKFIGNYNVSEACNSGNYTFTMVVTTSTAGLDKIVINNFGNFGFNVRADVSGSNVTYNDTQNGITVSGSGSIAGNTLTLIYTASQGASTDSCTGTCIKQ